ncbi:rhodanese-like domain-containing protein [Pseudomonas sp.]|jgi:phage shock protein E|uniref:rhodanese-like domain-containing protein n=1 Tax=Pseudomonas sp. TaxID=306 RepID=UPI00272F82B8|nr:rhodanese-like domain-containing protein [Pseudomonas sp.]MDP2245794.1 rhodanese-like domain-containing protein [Pseudomonas sp.]
MRILTAVVTLLLSLPLAADEVSPQQVVNALQAPGAVLIDVRTAEEFAAGALAGASRIGHEQIAEQIAALVPDKNTPIVLYCRSGRRSALAQDSLAQLGYRNLINAGGYDQLKLALVQQH